MFKQALLLLAVGAHTLPIACFAQGAPVLPGPSESGIVRREVRAQRDRLLRTRRELDSARAEIAALKAEAAQLTARVARAEEEARGQRRWFLPMGAGLGLALLMAAAAALRRPGQREGTPRASDALAERLRAADERFRALEQEMGSRTPQ